MSRLLAPLVLLACGGPPAEDTAEEAPTSGSFTLLTYNVHGLPDALTNTERPTAERMERIAPLLDAYDVVGLQEDFDAAAHESLLAQSSHPAQHWFNALFDEQRVYGSGLSLLSHVPTVEYADEHYTTCHGTFDGAGDCLASKGFQVLTLELGGRRLDVYNTHHEAGGGPEDHDARAAQVQAVLASMEGRSAGRAVVLLGDTNLRPSDPQDVPLLQAYADAGLRDACDEVGCPEPDHIDRFLVRDGDGLTLQVTGWSREAHFVDEGEADLSDHPALAITLEWAR